MATVEVGSTVFCDGLPERSILLWNWLPERVVLPCEWWLPEWQMMFRDWLPEWSELSCDWLPERSVQLCGVVGYPREASTVVSCDWLPQRSALSCDSQVHFCARLTSPPAPCHSWHFTPYLLLPLLLPKHTPWD